MKCRTYVLPKSDQLIVLTEEALKVFMDYRQQGDQAETGGLLFGTFDFPVIRVVEASLPQTGDRRWTILFIPDRIQQRRMIKKRFRDGLHFLGEWHTHPLAKPSPSSLDLQSMSDAFRKSRHELNWFVMVIVSNLSRRLDLSVSIHNGSRHHILKEITPHDQRRIRSD